MRVLVTAVVVVLAGSSASAQDAEKAGPGGEAASDGNADGSSNADGNSNADGGDDFQRVEQRAPRAGTPFITNKLYPMASRFEFTGTFDISYADKYVEHLGGHAGVGFHLFDWLAFEGFGGYLVGDETGIVKNVREKGKSSGLQRNNPGECISATCEPQLPDMWQSTWFAGADVQWSPIYGKISAVSEYDLNFQLYGRIGGGAEGIQLLLNAPVDGNQFTAAQIRPTGNYGFGLRLIPWKYVAIRAELVNYVGLNPNVPEHDDTDESSCPDGYTLGAGNGEQCLTDLSHNSMFQIGLSFIL